MQSITRGQSLQQFNATIFGEPCSKANSRRIVSIKGRPRSIKSAKALAYVKAFGEQCPVMEDMFEGDVEVDITIYYASRRPDLDESIILDELQGRAYRNDRQVKKKIITWGGVDKEEPRAIIHVRNLQASV